MENKLPIEPLQRMIQLLEEMNGLLKIMVGDQNQTLLSDAEEKLMDRLEVQEYLGFKEATYKRKVKEGKLKPMNLPGSHKYRKSDLLAEHNESIRRGRV